MSKTAVVLCPGRGSYTASELGYLSHSAPASVLAELNPSIDRLDKLRAARGDRTVRDMDASQAFSPGLFLGENASCLTFACTAFDFLRLDRNKLDIVGIGGNSMGWYSALFAAGAFSLDDTFILAEAMGGMTRDGKIGGQIIYPLVREHWRADSELAETVKTALEETHVAGHQAGWSIRYGGYGVLWADHEGLPLLISKLPTVKTKQKQYPLELPGHSAFHSPLMLPVSERALEKLSTLPWHAPSTPLIDGRGHRWHPINTNPEELCRYSLQTQVLEVFDFSACVNVLLREYAPELFILLGPGTALNAAVAQVLIANSWQGIDSKEAFLERQKNDPVLLSLAHRQHAELVTLPTT